MYSAFRAPVGFGHGKIDQPGGDERRNRQDFEQATPANPIQQPIRRRRCRDGSKRPKHDHAAIDERDSLLRKPGDNCLKPRHQGGGNTEPYHGAADEKLSKTIRVAEQCRTPDRNDQQHALDSPWTATIQEHADRDLGTGKDKEIDRCEQPGLGRAELKIGCQYWRNRRVDRSKEEREIVARSKGQENRKDESPF